MGVLDTTVHTGVRNEGWLGWCVKDMKAGMGNVHGIDMSKKHVDIPRIFHH